MLSQKCLNCSSEELIILGYGTQKIEDEIIQFVGISLKDFPKNNVGFP